MPKIMRRTNGDICRVLVPSRTCGACKGTGKFRFSNGTVVGCTNCLGTGRMC